MHSGFFEHVYVFHDSVVVPDLTHVFHSSSSSNVYILSTIPPSRNQRVSPNDGETYRSVDPVLTAYPNLGHCRWIGYCSTIGVYGPTLEKATESSLCRTTLARSQRRIQAEKQWTEVATTDNQQLTVVILRLPGIYGPGRGSVARVRAQRAQRIDTNHVFHRIHVDDIVQVCLASIHRLETPGNNSNPNIEIINVSDTRPCPAHEVVAHACEVLAVPDLPLVPWAEAECQMSEMAKSFYVEEKRISNAKMLEELEIVLLYPTYREGHASIVKEENDTTRGRMKTKSTGIILITTLDTNNRTVELLAPPTLIELRQIADQLACACNAFPSNDIGRIIEATDDPTSASELWSIPQALVTLQKAGMKKVVMIPLMRTTLDREVMLSLVRNDGVQLEIQPPVSVMSMLIQKIKALPQQQQDIRPYVALFFLSSTRVHEDFNIDQLVRDFILHSDYSAQNIIACTHTDELVNCLRPQESPARTRKDVVIVPIIRDEEVLHDVVADMRQKLEHVHDDYDLHFVSPVDRRDIIHYLLDRLFNV